MRVRILGGPLQGLHAAHAAAHHGQQALDPERIDQQFLGPDHIPHGDDREGQVIALAGFGIDGGRAGRPVAGTDHIGTDDKIAIGIEKFARADDGIPPARLCVVCAQFAGQMGIAGPGVFYQDGVGCGCVEGPVGFVDEGDRREDSSAVQPDAGLKGFGLFA